MASKVETKYRKKIRRVKLFSLNVEPIFFSTGTLLKIGYKNSE